MKKSNLFVFLISTAILASGLVSAGLVGGFSLAWKDFCLGAENFGVFSALESFTQAVEKLSAEKLRYHDILVDINSAFLRLVNTRVVVKDDSTVVRTESGYLANPRPYVEEEEIKDRARKVRELWQATEENGSEFLYVMAPSKGQELEFPSNVRDYTRENCDTMISYLDKYSVPTLNLIQRKQEQGISDEEMFFVTDHHWKPRYGLWAAGEISGELARRHGFRYDEEKISLSGYNIQNYENWFLGSQGKKVGRYFTSPGTDDIEIITPDFETSLIEEQPIKNQKREGTFENTVMYMGNVETKDHYNLNPYVAYSGGDFRLQIITNRLNSDGSKILFIRDSFGCAVAPFMALGASELHVVDVRDYEYYVGEKVNVFEYIEEIDPDYVLVLYNGVASNNDLYDFR